MIGKIGGPESLDIKNFDQYFQANCNSLINTIQKINKKRLKKNYFSFNRTCLWRLFQIIKKSCIRAKS